MIIYQKINQSQWENLDLTELCKSNQRRVFYGRDANGVEGLYVQHPNGDIFMLGGIGPEGPQGETGNEGPPGETGEQGPPGIDGVDGRTILNGEGPPNTGLGEEGDFYIDTDETELYGPKTSSGWGSPVSLIGSGGGGSAELEHWSEDEVYDVVIWNSKHDIVDQFGSPLPGQEVPVLQNTYERELLVGGQNNSVSGERSVVVGGYNNEIYDSQNAIVLGGQSNRSTSSVSAILAGISNEVSGERSVVLGGDSNDVQSMSASIVGGQNNEVTGSATFASIIGGEESQTNFANSVIAGGKYHQRSFLQSTFNVFSVTSEPEGSSSVVLGGWAHNTEASGVGGGTAKTPGKASAVLGGIQNWAGAEASVVIGGFRNKIPPSAFTQYGAIVGSNECEINEGIGNGIFCSTSSIAGGDGSVIIGGSNASTTAFNSTVVGATNSEAAANNSVVVGGNLNVADHLSGEEYNIIVGGDNNRTNTGNNSVQIGGKWNNRSFGNSQFNPEDFLIGKVASQLLDLFDLTAGGTSVNIGGIGNQRHQGVGFAGASSVKAGGVELDSTGVGSFAAGGVKNATYGPFSVVVGGSFNKAIDFQSSIIGGDVNIVSETAQRLPDFYGQEDTFQVQAENPSFFDAPFGAKRYVGVQYRPDGGDLEWAISEVQSVTNIGANEYEIVLVQPVGTTGVYNEDVVLTSLSPSLDPSGGMALESKGTIVRRGVALGTSDSTVVKGVAVGGHGNEVKNIHSVVLGGENIDTEAEGDIDNAAYAQRLVVAEFLKLKVYSSTSDIPSSHRHEGAVVAVNNSGTWSLAIWTGGSWQTTTFS